MAIRNIESMKDLEDAFNQLLKEKMDLQAECILNKILMQHAITRLATMSKDPAGYFDDFRCSSRINIEQGMSFSSGDQEENEAVLRRTLELHDQIFEMMSHVLGFRDQPIN